ncbi:hypothetical protein METBISCDRAFT_29734 [Metschnikowia bicuspidata]|uniref:C2H2-type domain-containing protein n=1 Tax=Metschnikowia bicuspidata TaxID=27322 RepID=A0A4P9ZIM4_9ASCO|nr:hypothetical protein METBISCDRAFT_29734 [Metschnikowia bicuspidata]
MAYSTFGGDSLPTHAPMPNSFNFLQRHSPVVEHNVSYARSGALQHPQLVPTGLDLLAPTNLQDQQNHQTMVHAGPDMPLGAQINGDMDEDARFIRIADDALVATSTEFNLIVDQNIQDLLVRLRYVLSPHGNPIHSAENIHANENGQLMIQQFYKDFSNLRNDIFDGSFEAAPRNRRPNTKNDWDFLLNKESPNATTENGDLHSPSGERKYPCEDCLRSFHRSSDLRRHVKQHFKIPANICAQCGKGFARKDALKRHLGTMTCKRNASKKLYRKNLDYLAS